MSSVMGNGSFSIKPALFIYTVSCFVSSAVVEKHLRQVGRKKHCPGKMYYDDDNYSTDSSEARERGKLRTI